MGGPHTVTRNIGAFATLPSAAAVAAAMANGTFNPFARALEGMHNSGHVWVGGSMSSILTAPADPVFWMHHAEIDRIWAAVAGGESRSESRRSPAPRRRWTRGARPRSTRETSWPWATATTEGRS